MPAAAPARFGRFELIERIGAGGMAEVFRAAVIGPEGFRRELVVKRVLPQLSVRTKFTQMFVNEAKISALLTHPNIVQIFEFGESDGAYFIAMESVRGMTLREALTKLRQQARVMPLVAAAEITREVLIALDYAHNLRGADGHPLEIVHRDISPSNIMLADTGAVKVLDFGIARAADYIAEDEGKVVKGKIAYLAPEQITCAGIDARVDVFATGCVLHEILTGRVMFRAQNDLQKKVDLLAQPSSPPSAWNSDVPPALDKIVARATARDPDARYSSSADMLTDVENYLASFRSSSRAVLRLVRSLSAEFRPEDTGDGSVPSPASTATPATTASSPGGAKPGKTSSTLIPTRGSSATDYAARRDDGNAGSLARGELLPAAGSQSQRLGGAAFAERSRFTRDVWHRRFVMTTIFALGLGMLAGAVVGARSWLKRIAASSPSVVATDEAPAPFVLMTFTSTPPEARIVDGGGRTIGSTPATLPITPSPVIAFFRFEKDGYQPITASVVPDADRTVSVELRPLRRSEKGARKTSAAKRGNHSP